MRAIGKLLLAAGSAALVLSIAGASVAHAGGKKKHRYWDVPNGHNSFMMDDVSEPTYYFGGGSRDCRKYRRMFRKTGNFFWKAKYYACVY